MTYYFDLNKIMDKNILSLELFMEVFSLLIKMFIMIMKYPKNSGKISVVLLNDKYE